MSEINTGDYVANEMYDRIGKIGYPCAGGSKVSNDILAYQNMRANDHIKDIDCKVKSSELGVISNTNLTAALGDIRDQARFKDTSDQISAQTLSLDNKIDRQSIAAETRLNAFEATYNADKKAELLAENSVLKNHLNLKEGCVNTTCCTCSGGCSGGSSGVDASSIQIAINNSIAQIMPTLLSAMGK